MAINETLSKLAYMYIHARTRIYWYIIWESEGMGGDVALRKIHLHLIYFYASALSAVVHFSAAPGSFTRVVPIYYM